MTEHFHFHRILCTFGLVAQLVKNPPAMQEDPVSIPGSGRALGEGNGNPLQYSCLENPKNRGAWRATVHGTAQSRTRLCNFLSQSSMQLIKNKASLCTDAQQWKEQTAQQYVTMILRVLKHMHIHTCAHAYEGTALPGYTGPYLQGGGLIFQLLPCCTISVSSVCLC